MLDAQLLTLGMVMGRLNCTHYNPDIYSGFCPVGSRLTQQGISIGGCGCGCPSSAPAARTSTGNCLAAGAPVEITSVMRLEDPGGPF